MSTKSVEAWVCDKCEHVWYTNGAKPKRCAKCKSPRWDEARGGQKVPPAKAGRQRRSGSTENDERKAVHKQPNVTIPVVSSIPNTATDIEYIRGVSCRICKAPMFERKNETLGTVKWVCDGTTRHVESPRELPPASPLGSFPVDFDPEELL